MNKSFIIVVLLFSIFCYIIYYSIFAKRLKLVRVVKRDLETYRNIKETNTYIYPFLIEAWNSTKEYAGRVTSANIGDYDDEMAWSAATISLWMKKSGIKGFPSSARHSVYVTAAKEKREYGYPVSQDEDTKLKLYKVSEFSPRIGDLICYSRGSKRVNYDSVYVGAKLHCDVVIDVTKDSVIAVGGNVSDMIKETTYRTDKGFVVAKLDKYGKPTDTTFVGVIKNGHF